MHADIPLTSTPSPVRWIGRPLPVDWVSLASSRLTASKALTSARSPFFAAWCSALLVLVPCALALLIPGAATTFLASPTAACILSLSASPMPLINLEIRRSGS